MKSLCAHPGSDPAVFMTGPPVWWSGVHLLSPCSRSQTTPQKKQVQRGIKDEERAEEGRKLPAVSSARARASRSEELHRHPPARVVPRSVMPSIPPSWTRPNGRACDANGSGAENGNPKHRPLGLSYGSAYVVVKVRDISQP